ncbi:hypothetical protein TREMEDRAFT_20118, partial [Tremella mesenterica DSM 1558]|uniref:uncharacterized protein n=1 Tax=Tremella mesenterica (strain ATCC 24925 / CBS 8224 / DSM 1558 / NBRC 9311 / NRRL Y-6157 / RJB 2259-6 / UBC 559-6) TaxID=578456 RepID=UPI0003F4A063
YFYNVKMTCTGCSGAVTRVLQKKVEFFVSLEGQYVAVWGDNLPSESEIQECIKKTGKPILSAQLVPAGEPLPAL